MIRLSNLKNPCTNFTFVSRITELEPELLADLASLTELNLAHNQISRLSRSPFHNLTRLRLLDLSDNGLTGLDAAGLAGLGGQLSTLRLSRNQINFIQEEAFNKLTGL